MMTSFGWKRKAGEKVSHGAAASFTENEHSDEEDEAIKSGEVDWITLQAPKRKVLVLEDGARKSQRLASEGAVLAEAERYWEALKKWNEALQLTPQDGKIYEMKSQAYASLNEVFPALQAASRAIELDPLWWPAHQTMGRAHLGLGEVRLGVKSFCRALHLNPAEEELWQEDLAWACDLLAKKQHVQKELRDTTEQTEKTETAQINVLDDTSECTALEPVSNDVDHGGGNTHDINRVPSNYVAMRDLD